MRHRIARHKLGRKTAHRQAMQRNFACSLIMHERVETTLATAKGMRRGVEKLLTLGKKKDLASVRRAMGMLQDRVAVAKLFDVLGPRYASRPGGYTRIVRLPGYRIGDGGSKAMIELVGSDVLERKLEQQAATAAASEE
jgi:large subunit ribosomal protein L17